MNEHDPLPPNPTLAQAKEWITFAMKPKADARLCPCCHQKVATYRRRIDSKMARQLVALCRLYTERKTWIHITDVSAAIGSLGGSQDFGKLRHWGLVAEKPLVVSARDSKTTSTGYWMPLPAAYEYIKGDLQLASHAFLCLDQVVAFENTLVTIRAAFGKHFDFSKLIRGEL